MKLKVTSNEVQQVEYDMSNDPALQQGYDDEDDMDYLSESDKKLIDNKLKADEKLMLIYVHNKTINVSFTENFTLI